MSADSPLVLIVDDEPRILSALRRSLRREPYEVITVESFREAYHVLESQPVTVLATSMWHGPANPVRLWTTKSKGTWLRLH